MKKFLVFICLLLFIGVSVLTVSADTPDEGTVNSAGLTYFTGVVNNLPPNCNYVIYRSDDYSTRIVYSSDLTLKGSTFSCNGECTSLTYNSRGSGSGTSYTPTVTLSPLNSFTLNTSNNHIIYSSLGSYSSVGDTSRDTFTYILWSVVFLILIFVVLKFFRNRRHYINL